MGLDIRGCGTALVTPFRKNGAAMTWGSSIFNQRSKGSISFPFPDHSGYPSPSGLRLPAGLFSTPPSPASLLDRGLATHALTLLQNRLYTWLPYMGEPDRNNPASSSHTAGRPGPSTLAVSPPAGWTSAAYRSIGLGLYPSVPGQVDHAGQSVGSSDCSGPPAGI